VYPKRGIVLGREAGVNDNLGEYGAHFKSVLSEVCLTLMVEKAVAGYYDKVNTSVGSDHKKCSVSEGRCHGGL